MLMTGREFLNSLAKGKSDILQQFIGYEMEVAALENALQGKVWAYTDETREPLYLRAAG
jgi:vacuolar-type H+-ATPase subunit C/Vma6